MLWEERVLTGARGTGKCLKQGYGNSYKVTVTEDKREDEIVAFRLLGTRFRLVNLSARTAVGCLDYFTVTHVCRSTANQ